MPAPMPAPMTPWSSSKTRLAAIINPKRHPPVTLDYLSYPHIIDSIFLSAERGTLIKLRLVCKTFMARADAILAYHVSFSKDRPDLVCYAGGREWRSPPPNALPPRVPGLPWKGARHQYLWETDAKSVERFATILGNTRVAAFPLDYDPSYPYAWGDCTTDLARACRALVNVDTLVAAMGYQRSCASTIRARRVIISVSDFWELGRTWAHPYPCISGPTCYGVQHIVLYMHGPSTDFSIPLHMISALWAPSLRDLTLIFNVARPIHCIGDPPLGILTELVFFLAVSIPTLKVKVAICQPVYGAIFGGYVMDSKPHLTKNEVQQRIFGGIVNALYPHSPTEDDVHSCERLFHESFTFLTVAAYHASIPEADFSLETFGHFDGVQWPDKLEDEDDEAFDPFGNRPQGKKPGVWAKMRYKARATFRRRA